MDAGGDCVEVACTGESVLVRDSKDRRGPVVAFAPAVWESFLGFMTPPSLSENASKHP